MTKLIRTIGFLTLALTAFLLAKPAFAKQDMTITTTFLGTLGGNSSTAFCINNKGQAVGSSATTAGVQHAFIWQNGVMTDLGALGAGFSEAIGINDAGQVVGASELGGWWHGFIWKDGVMTDLGTLGGATSMAYDINNKGQVVGSSETSPGVVHAFIWQDGMMTDLGTLGGKNSVAYAINNRGQVAGSSERSDGRLQAFIWKDGEMTDLGAFDEGYSEGGYSEGYGINGRGQVVGASTVYVGHIASPWIPAMWQKGEILRISTTPTPYEGSFVRAMNNRGQAAGYDSEPIITLAYILQDGVITRLTQPANGKTWESWAYSINNRGQVAGVVVDLDLWDYNFAQAVIWTVK